MLAFALRLTALLTYTKMAAENKYHLKSMSEEY
jgi:hypothetical protein